MTHDVERRGDKMIQTALILIAPEQDLKVIGLLTEVNGLLKYARNRVIAVDEDLVGATNDLTLMANLGKAIKEKQKEYADPIKEYLKGVNDAFGLLILPLNEADIITRGKVLDYRKAQEAKRQEIERINRLRMEAAEAEAKLNGTGEITESVNLIPEAPPSVAHVKTEAGTLSTMKVTKWEVIDFKALPEDYKMVDAAKLGAVVRAAKGNIIIPGVRIWQEETLTIKAKL